jgi:thiol-disulfide isomerase/thioredoxin
MQACVFWRSPPNVKRILLALAIPLAVTVFLCARIQSSLDPAVIAHARNPPKKNISRSELEFSEGKQHATQQTVVTGTLLDSEGHSIPRAHAHLERFSQSKPLVSVPVGQDGSFKLVTTETGLLVVRFTGVDHQSRKVTLLVDKPMKIELNVRLKTYDYRDDFAELKIIGDFNDFSFKSAREMNRRSDGTYFAEFDTAASRFAYQLLGVKKGGGSINGTQSEDYVYDGGGDYRSIVMPKNGHVTVTFDPRKLVRSEAAGRVRFKDVTSSAARFVSIYEAMMRRRDQLHDALVEYKKTGRPLNEFSYDWSSDLTDLAQGISKEKRPLLRQALLFSYLDTGFGNYGAKLDATIARKALGEIAPTSPLWSIEPILIGVAIAGAGSSQRYTSYVQEVINKHSDPAVVKIIRATLSPDRQIVVGKTVPAFSLAAFERPGTIYTSEHLKGKVVLIDFWATWCLPCIEEMPNLHQEYEKFKAQGFEILSVSLDESPEVVNEFRKEKWKMPWLHSLLTSSPDVKKQFEIIGIPRAVLIDRDGRIVATDRELRGRNLDQTLTQLLRASH